MINEYFVKSPSAFFYEQASKSSAVTDELLYGTRLFGVSSEPESEQWMCAETDFGYRGFVQKSNVQRRTGAGISERFVVTAPFCDVLPVPEYKYRPFLTLPKGSILEKTSDYGNVCGFTDVSICGKRFFVRAENVTLKKELDEIQTPDKKRKNIVDTALSYLETAYRWGGKSPCGIDCSGLCFESYFLNGIKLWRDAVPDGKYVRQIRYEELKEGDLIYFKGHVVMYIGAGEYIHSSAALGKVCISSFDKNSAVYYPKLDGKIIMCARSIALGD